MNRDHKDFGELYRSAFAERDPQRKLELLGQVRQAIDDWERVVQTHVDLASSRRQPHPASSRPGAMTQVA